MYFRNIVGSAALVFLLPSIYAQGTQGIPLPSPAQNSSPAPQAKSLEEQRDLAAGQLAEATGKLKEFPDGETPRNILAAGLTDEDVTTTQNTWKSIESNYRGIVTELDRLITLRDNPPPQPVVAAPQDEAAAEKLQDDTRRLRESLAPTETANLREKLFTRQTADIESASKEVRLAQEALDNAPAEAKEKFAAILALKQTLEKEKKTVLLCSTRKDDIRKIEIAGTLATIKANETALAASPYNSIFSQKRAEAALADIATRITTTEKQIAETKKALEQAQQALASADETTKTVCHETVSLLENSLRNRERFIPALEAISQWWKKIHELAEDTSDESLVRSLRSEIRQTTDNWTDYLQLLDSRNREIQSRLDQLADAPKSSGSLARAEAARLAALRQRLVWTQEVYAFLTETSTLATRILDESASLVSIDTWHSSLQASLTNTWKSVFSALDAEAFSTERSVYVDGVPVTRTRSISYGKIAIALLIALLALFFSGRIARMIGHHLQNKWSVEIHRARTVQRCIYVALLVIVTMLLLHYLSIPITAFAFLGGALAIGVGFGAQNLTNNFISGIILTIERRIKVGDIIEVEGFIGRVTLLTTRCAYIECFDGIEVLIPNSHLLERNVVNWTLSNSRRRRDFAVNVAYGTDVKIATRLLETALNDNKNLLTTPAPQVFFEEFGESALVLRVYYWLDIRKTDIRLVNSELHTRIEELFRENHITIPYPNRTIHIAEGSTGGKK